MMRACRRGRPREWTPDAQPRSECNPRRVRERERCAVVWGIWEGARAPLAEVCQRQRPPSAVSAPASACQARVACSCAPRPAASPSQAHRHAESSGVRALSAAAAARCALPVRRRLGATAAHTGARLRAAEKRRVARQ